MTKEKHQSLIDNYHKEQLDGLQRQADEEYGLDYEDPSDDTIH